MATLLLLAACLVIRNAQGNGDATAAIKMRWKRDVAACAAGEAARCPQPPRHVHARRADSPFPNALNVPQLVPVDTEQARRARHRQLPDGSFAHSRQRHNFTGVTSVGFIDMRSDGVLANTTVPLDDFAAVLAGASFACEPLAAFDGGAADAATTRPFILPDATGLVRNPVQLTLRLPRAAPLAAAEAQEQQLLLQRLAIGNVLVFGHGLLRAHVDFAQATTCGHQIPADAPYYRIADCAGCGAATASDSELVSLVLALAPADFGHLWGALNHHFEWEPDTDKELARRRLAGLPLGDPLAVAAHERRRLKSSFPYIKNLVAPMSVNFNGNLAAPGASQVCSWVWRSRSVVLFVSRPVPQ